jgi:phosphoribosylformylglycinamidine (FGAM) synthase-like enzyme
VLPTKLAAVLAIARQYNVGAREIGKVKLSNALRIEYKGSAVVDSPIDALRGIWANSLEQTLTSK